MMTTGGLRGTRKLDLNGEIIERDSKEYLVYEMVGYFNEVWKERNINPSEEYLPLAKHVKVAAEEKYEREEQLLILIFQNLDYQPFPLPYLDYCHTLVAVSRLARLHAISYICRMESSISDVLLSTCHKVPTVDRVTLDRLEIVLGDDEDGAEVVDFIRTIDKPNKENNLDIFGVFCPGNLNVDNLLFCCSVLLLP